ncbi:hypothetical protein MKX79_05970 [Viridibacillus sp. FSL R5-0468]
MKNFMILTALAVSIFVYYLRIIHKPQHCGRYLLNIHNLPNSASELRLKHLGWANEQERLQKLERYKALDPGAKYGDIRQYTSILDENPNLIEWQGLKRSERNL